MGGFIRKYNPFAVMILVSDRRLIECVKGFIKTIFGSHSLSFYGLLRLSMRVALPPAGSAHLPLLFALWVFHNI